MKNIRFYFITILFALSSVTNAQPMSYEAMHNNARFLTDRMAYTLGIRTAAVIDDIYRINYDYICGVNDYLDDIALGYYSSEYDYLCYERDRALEYLLGSAIWNRIRTYDYFYRPIVFADRRWRFSIYAHDTRYNHFYYSVPTHYHSYHGGHFFNGMSSRGITPRHQQMNKRGYSSHYSNNKDNYRNGNVNNNYRRDNNNYDNHRFNNNNRGERNVDNVNRENRNNSFNRSESNVRSSSRFNNSGSGRRNSTDYSKGSENTRSYENSRGSYTGRGNRGEGHR